jgi:hypothetical protein
MRFCVFVTTMLLCAFKLDAQTGPMRISSNGEVLRSIADFGAATQAEAQLLADPGNLDLAGQLLDFYLRRWEQANVRAARLRIILWSIANHPDIQLAGRHDPRGLLVNPEDRQDYARVRAAWLDQVSRNSGNARVLANAARCLRLTDRETAANWLKQAIQLDSQGRFFVSDLGDVYADAISGISGMNPWEGPTSVDAAETRSDFAKLAVAEAAKESELAVRTGWALHQVSEALRVAKIEAPDYDPVAEKLLIQAANLDYPKPGHSIFLLSFYRGQQRKASDRVLPKWRTVEVSAEEQSARLVEGSKQVFYTANGFQSAVTIPVRITIGIDGHVWKAEALGAPQIAGPVAAASTATWIYEPLRIDSEPIQVSTLVQVTVEPLVPR